MWCSTSGSFVAWRRRLRPRWKSSNSFLFSGIDPFHLETSYYVAPDEGGEKDYALLLKSMKETGYAALGQVTMHRRDHVMILRSGKTGLIAHTMFSRMRRGRRMSSEPTRN